MSYSLMIPWTEVHQAPLSIGFPRQEYLSGLPFPLLGYLPDPEIKSMSPALAGGFFTTESLGKPICFTRSSLKNLVIKMRGERYRRN